MADLGASQMSRANSFWILNGHGADISLYIYISGLSWLPTNYKQANVPLIFAVQYCGFAVQLHQAKLRLASTIVTKEAKNLRPVDRDIRRNRNLRVDDHGIIMA